VSGSTADDLSVKNPYVITLQHGHMLTLCRIEPLDAGGVDSYLAPTRS